ncbi:MAG: 23S rRNA (adenine(1618)-N(6))-methyltransferase RlmF [Bacteroidia bacterium]|nr:23S rRNA (adenine(1618)-N(6))-methyltransferase RlmF [Bacteroidia bacterium]
MQQKKKEIPTVKPKLHPRNKNRERYNFKELKACCPELVSFVKLNLYNDESIDFANPEAVKVLNKAILKYHYGIESWDIPEGYLCPPIPGRADYIHHIADLLCRNNYGKIPVGEKIKCMDVGIGANSIYPIIGVKEYGWSFIGSDIDPISIANAKNIISENLLLKGKVECRMQENPKDFFYSVISKDEIIDFTICNPPFHPTIKEAQSGTLRKLSNLNKHEISEPIRNFGGQYNELCYKGGEERFVGNMIRESKKFSKNCFWYTSLVAKQTHLRGFYELLKHLEATEVETIPMGQGNKTSRILAWSFLTKEEQKSWKNTRWNDFKKI